VSVAAVPADRLLAWGRRWGISTASLVAGLATLLVFRRGLPHAHWIVGYLLLIWLLVAVMLRTGDALAASSRRSLRLVAKATEYTIQSLYHGVLLFLLPAYAAAATFTSPNVLFVAVLVALAVLATFDPWYQTLVHPRPWAGHVFFLVSLFGGLNLALPLVGVPPFPSLLLSAWIAVVALTPVAARAWDWPWPRALIAMMALGVVAALAASAGRAWVPPAPLFLARASLAWGTEGDATAPLPASPIRAVDLHERGLAAHTAIYAPAGLRQPVEHVWRLRGEALDRVRLTPIEGGRREGYRTYSRKTGFPADPVGRWTVDVMTLSGQLIGRLRFRVVP
jgi:hypothetical protein